MAPKLTVTGPSCTHPSRESNTRKSVYYGKSFLAAPITANRILKRRSNVDDIAECLVYDGILDAGMQFTVRCDVPAKLDGFPTARRSQRCITTGTETRSSQNDQFCVYLYIRPAMYVHHSFCTSISSNCRTLSRSSGTPYRSAPSNHGVTTDLSGALGISCSLLKRYAKLVSASIRCNATTPQNANSRCRAQGQRCANWSPH